VLRGGLDTLNASAIAVRGGVHALGSEITDGATILRGGIKPVQDTKTAFSILQIALQDSTGKFKDSFQILDDVRVKLNGFQDVATKGAIASSIFGRGWAAQLKILSDLADATGKLQRWASA
jgi:hypothetical protein